MNDEKLIEFVRLHPALYNLGDPKYVDAKYKNYLWRKISLELKLNETDWVVCKNRWINIRDQFKKYLKNRVNKKTLSSKNVKKYKYADLLQFLTAYDDNRENRSNYSLHDNQVPIETEVPQTEIKDEYVHQQSPQSESSDSDSDNEKSPEETTASTDYRRYLKTSPDVSAYDSVMKYIEEHKVRKDSNDEVHPMDAFLSGLSPTIKSFSPYFQHIAKGQIFKVIHDLELQQLSQGMPSSP